MTKRGVVNKTSRLPPRPSILKTILGQKATQIAFRTLVAGIPYAGGPILELWAGAAQRRVQERLHNVFAAMKDCIERLSESKIDRAFFESEEFQSLLFLLLEKLHTTHDADKLKIFGSALANSGNVAFRADDKRAVHSSAARFESDRPQDTR